MYLYVIRRETMLLSNGLAWAITVLTVVLLVLAIYNSYLFRKGDLVRHAIQRVTIASSVGGIVMLEIQLLGTYGQGLDQTLVFAIETVTAIVAVAILAIFGGSLLARAKSFDDASYK